MKGGQNMKINWNDKYNTIAAYVLIVFIMVALLFVIFFRNDTISSIFSTILNVLRSIAIGATVAYFLNRPTMFFENKVFKFKNGHKRISRGLSVTCVYILLVAFLTGFVAIMYPQIRSGYTDLSNKMPMYISSVTEWLNKQAESSSILSSVAVKLVDFLNNLINNTYDIISTYIPNITTIISNAAYIIKDVGLGLIVSVYFILTKDKLIAQAKKILKAVFKDKFFNKLQDIWKLIDKSFGGFIIGKVFDSTIIGLISLLVLWLIGIPYYPLISVIIAITNIVPIFGPLVGGILGGFIVFVTNGDLLIWFIIYDVVIQQIDGNIIGPKILGQSVGLSATWIFVSLTVMGNIFGFAGMIFGVPLFAVIYTLIKQYTEKRLEKKNLPVNTYDYISTENGREIFNEIQASKEKKELSKQKRMIKFKSFIDKLFHKNNNQNDNDNSNSNESESNDSQEAIVSESTENQ